MRNGDSRLGILAFLGATALVLLALVLLARYPSLLQRGSEYNAAFRSVAGLNLGDDVRYGGFLVGAITAIQLDPADPTRIRVTFKVRGNTPVREDTRASITQLGLLGQPFLNLTPGRADSDPLPSGSRVRSEDNLSFSDAMSRLGNFLDRADTLMRGAERLASGTPWQRIDRTLARLDTLVIRASSSSDRVMAQLDTASGRLNDVLARTERVVVGVDTAFRRVGPNLASTQREAMEALRDVRSLVAELRDAVERGNRAEEIMRNLAVATERLAHFTERLDRNPTSLLGRPQPPPKAVGPRP